MDERYFSIARENGENEQKYYEISKILDAIISECKLDYSGKKLDINSDALTTILKVYNRKMVESQIKFLQEIKNND